MQSALLENRWWCPSLDNSGNGTSTLNELWQAPTTPQSPARRGCLTLALVASVRCSLQRRRITLPLLRVMRQSESRTERSRAGLSRLARLRTSAVSLVKATVTRRRRSASTFKRTAR